MSDQPATPDKPVGESAAPSADVLAVDPLDDEIVEVTDTFAAPDIQALVALVLAIAAVCGFGVVDGTYYFGLITDADSRHTFGILAEVLGAVFALAPVVLGWRASAQVLETDPRWVAVAARAAVILGLTAVILRLVLAIFAAAAPEAF